MSRAVQDVQVAVRMPSALVAELDRWVAERGTSRAELLREAAAVYLDRLRCERDAVIYGQHPLTEEELAAADSDAVLRPSPRGMRTLRGERRGLVGRVRAPSRAPPGCGPDTRPDR